MLTLKKMNFLTRYREQINELCRIHKVKSLYAFGSVLNEKFNSDSDIDLIVDFSEVNIEEYADNYFELKFTLQKIFKRPIDLLEAQAIKNPFFKKKIDSQKELIYG